MASDDDKRRLDAKWAEFAAYYEAAGVTIDVDAIRKDGERMGMQEHVLDAGLARWAHAASASLGRAGHLSASEFRAAVQDHRAKLRERLANNGHRVRGIHNATAMPQTDAVSPIAPPPQEPPPMPTAVPPPETPKPTPLSGFEQRLGAPHLYVDLVDLTPPPDGPEQRLGAPHVASDDASHG